MNRITPLVMAFSLAALPFAHAADFSVESLDDGVVIKIDGELFTKYITGDEVGNKPYFWPIIGPTGKSMTRAYPMEDVEGEKQDHPHHRSMWFGQQDINGFDTWHEPLSYTDRFKNKPDELAARMAKLGSTRNDSVTAESKGDHAVLESASTYLNAKGEEMLKDRRRFVFRVDPTTSARMVDVEITFEGSQDTVTLGDAKDAGFSLRVAWSMSVDADEKAKIINSHGDMDKDAWSKKADWCVFHGPVEGDHLGIAMLNHPSSFRYPNPWHVRTYGLFTANPFGTNSLDSSAPDGSVVLKKGETLTLRYRVIFHEGDEKDAKIEEEFQAYAAEEL